MFGCETPDDDDVTTFGNHSRFSAWIRPGVAKSVCPLALHLLLVFSSPVLLGFMLLSDFHI